MHIEISGPVEAPAILFIHGFPLVGAMWRPAVELLQREFRCFIPDLRGFGGSEPAPGGESGCAPSIALATYADDLAMLLDALAVAGPVTVVGLSMGGYIAFEMWRRYRARILALVLADTRAEADPPARRQERGLQAERVLRDGSTVIADAMLPNLFAASTPAAVKAEWRRIMAATPPETVAAALGALAARPDSTSTLPTILCPTLIVVGEHDLITPPDLARSMHRAIRTSRLEVIPGAGHMAPLEQPEAFASAVRQFMARPAE
jgi:pimeloyl-ACP methyl ester carboxylesterase